MSELEENLDLSDYIGKWIAIVDAKVVAFGFSGKDVFDEAKSLYPDSEPFVMKVPKNQPTLLCINSGSQEGDREESDDLTEEEIQNIMSIARTHLAGRVEYAVDNGKEIRNLTDEELEEADRR